MMGMHAKLEQAMALVHQLIAELAALRAELRALRESRERV